jgi:hypothetical protein
LIKVKKYLSLFLFCCLAAGSSAQKKLNPVYVDRQGVMRWTKDNTEANFFGVNYTVPFAYGYRSHKALGIDIEKAIDIDVHHMSLLDIDAFRVHVWDVEISDSLGNVLENEHLRLFDYLISKLKEKNIRILITPIAFWGNGYPERDIRTNGFSYVYGKGPSVVKEEAFKAQENYLKQFFNHVNPYTKLKYKDDPDVIAMEINNEPHHSGPKERTTEYVNRMADAVRSTGWTKPIFYNISESPAYADAIVKAKVDGHSFQWYPTGLVANREQKGNFLPNVAQYHIPFGDTIPAFKKRALMVYEFDAGDVMQPIMYPAMARSYRTAGFQWATQFAYDPVYTAYANTEYQTHYLNLVYTPAKAISLLIASKVFHRLPRGKSYGTYPADTLFDVFRVSYKQQLSEMNSEEEFYYTGNTTTKPKNISKLKHIAGVGSSPVVEYEGTGAYFLDKEVEGETFFSLNKRDTNQVEIVKWKLEVMPDAILVDDPFEKASPRKEIVKIIAKSNVMKLNIPGLEEGFTLMGLNEGNFGSWYSDGNTISVKPGIYSVVQNKEGVPMRTHVHRPPENHVPANHFLEPVVSHKPTSELTAGQPLNIGASITGVDTADHIFVELRHSSNRWKTVEMEPSSAYQFSAAVPVDMVTPGQINYRIILRKSNGDVYTFPGGFKGDPYAWDEWRNETWSTFISSDKSPIEIFHATRDRNKVMLYSTDWRNNSTKYIAADDPGRLALKTTMNKPAAGQIMGWQFFMADKTEGRQTQLKDFSSILIKARSTGNLTATLSLIDTEANGWSSPVNLTNEWKTIEIPLSALKKDSILLLPRPYPGFQKLWFQSASNKNFALADIEKIELRFASESTEPAGVEVQWVRVGK